MIRFQIYKKGVIMKEYQRGFEIIQELIAKRWIPEILYSIAKGNNKYTSILNSISFLSQTELQRKLKALEEHRCLNKDRERGEYYLTDFGMEINHLFQHFYDLGRKYMDV